jgi:hypothetical protein
MFKYKWIMVIFCLLAWPVNHCLAEEDQKAPQAQEVKASEDDNKVPQLFQLHEIEVTEQELKTDAETPNMTVIKPEILLQGLGTTLDGALKRQPGVDVQRMQEVGGALDDDSIKIRARGVAC